MSSVFLLTIITEDMDRYCSYASVAGVYSTEKLAEKHGQEIFESGTRGILDSWEVEEWEIDDNT